MKKIIALIFCIMLLSTVVIAETPNLLPAEISKGTELPSFARPLFGNQRINLYITASDNQEITSGIVTEDGIIAEVNDKGVEKPTLKAYTKQACC